MYIGISRFPALLGTATMTSLRSPAEVGEWIAQELTSYDWNTGLRWATNLSGF